LNTVPTRLPAERSGTTDENAARTIAGVTGSEDLRFRAGDVTLSATLTLPDAEGRSPWALFVPSWLPRDRDGGWDRTGHPGWFARPSDAADGIFARLASALVHHGVASLRYDPRGCGDSEGEWARTDLFTRIDDARDAIGAMRSRRELDLRRCAIVGHGEGAAIAISAAIGDPAIGAVGLIGPSARSLRDVLRRGVAERARTGADRRHPIVDALDRSSEELIERAQRHEPSMAVHVGADTVELNLAAWEQGFHTPVLALATMLHRNVVIAHGSDDAWADPEESQLFAQVLRDGGNQPLLQALDGAGHDLAEADDAAVDAFAAALAERIQRRELPPVLVAIEQMRADD
jgi:pimeloyl-ACP methyl ester carboxylesterase